MRIIDAAEVAARLDHRTCIGLMREAMVALSKGRTRQLLRGILPLDDAGNMLGVMPGSLDGTGFGAKLVSVYPHAPLGRTHQGVIALFDPATGAPTAIVDAGEVTAIRTACASAAATDALALPGPSVHAILGTGEQAYQHALAIPLVRDVTETIVWGRSPEKARALAARIGGRVAATVAEAVANVRIVSATTAAAAPILLSADVGDGTHINLVGSSHAGPVEIDNPLVARARFVPDHRDGVLAQGAEFLNAKAAGLIGDEHVLPEIGAILAGDAPGRLSPADVTIYKSLGSVVQDLACSAWLTRA